MRYFVNHVEFSHKYILRDQNEAGVGEQYSSKTFKNFVSML